MRWVWLGAFGAVAGLAARLPAGARFELTRLGDGVRRLSMPMPAARHAPRGSARWTYLKELSRQFVRESAEVWGVGQGVSVESGARLDDGVVALEMTATRASTPPWADDDQEPHVRIVVRIDRRAGRLDAGLVEPELPHARVCAGPRPLSGGPAELERMRQAAMAAPRRPRWTHDPGGYALDDVGRPYPHLDVRRVAEDDYRLRWLVEVPVGDDLAHAGASEQTYERTRGVVRVDPITARVVGQGSKPYDGPYDPVYPAKSDARTVLGPARPGDPTPLYGPRATATRDRRP
jgi:hypothetical protein